MTIYAQSMSIIGPFVNIELFCSVLFLGGVHIALVVGLTVGVPVGTLLLLIMAGCIIYIIVRRCKKSSDNFQPLTPSHAPQDPSSPPPKEPEADQLSQHKQTENSTPDQSQELGEFASYTNAK